MFMTVVGYSVIIPSEGLFTLCTQIVIGLITYIPLRMKLLSDEDRKMMKTWPAPVNRLSNVKS